jgi:MFS transporter, ACS family, glucarate transporter
VPKPEQPSRTRYGLVGFAVLVAVISYVDRIAISQAAPLISRDLGLTRLEMGVAFSAFGIAYSIFQVPGGWIADWKGLRRVLTIIVVWWSVFTAVSGWAWSQTSLVAARFLFGAGQSSAFAVVTKAFTTWLPTEERVRAQGIMWMSARWGGAFTPLLVAAMLQFLSWRRIFEVLCLLGLVWAFVFWRWFRDNPNDHPKVNDAEKALLAASSETATGHGDVPWKLILKSRTVWMLWLQYFCQAYGWYFYVTWLPTYLQEARGQSMGESAFLAGFPLFFGGLGSLSCGFVLRHLERWLGSVTYGRRVIAGVGLFGAGLLLIISVHLSNPIWAMVAMGLASFGNDLAMPPSWATAMDVGGNYAGSLSASMNMAGNVAAWLAPAMVALILTSTNDNWAITFYVSGAIYFVGAFAWTLIDPVTPVEPTNVGRSTT